MAPDHKRLFIPGPTEVGRDILDAMGTWMIGHRSREYKELQGRVSPKLQKFLYTERPVFLGTCSSTGWMEGAVRNCVLRRCVNFCNGAFSERWHKITLANGIEADAVTQEWGKPIYPEMVDEALSSGKYDAMTLVHNETSTGVMSPLEEIASLVREKYPDVCLIVDAVSSMAAVKLEFDKLGLDVLLAGVQKAFALPAGLAVCAVSERAMERSSKAKNKGYYFDFEVFLKYWEKNQTPATPCISQVFALDRMLDKAFEEGLENRWARHRRMAEYVRGWARERFALYAEPGYESVSLTTVKNTRNIDVEALNEFLARKGAVIANGYGKTKDQVFRIAHMGDYDVKDLQELTGWIDEFLGLA